MKVTLAPGTYVLAVSGGVDSMVLLDLLSRLPGVRLVVAHYDHGIRLDSANDRKLVQAAAKQYDLPFVYEEGRLGTDASEDQARQARYAFLGRVQQQTGAQAIVTAHHQGDVIETMLLNTLRGTGRRGLGSLRSTSKVTRPLLDCTKNELQQYAIKQGIQWHEDSTNADMTYKRNYIRHIVSMRMSPAQRNRLLQINKKMLELNRQIDTEITEVLHAICVENMLVRKKFIMLPHAVACEVMAEYMRQFKVRNLSRQLVDHLVVAVKTARPHTVYDVDKAWVLQISATNAGIKPRHPA